MTTGMTGKQSRNDSSDNWNGSPILVIPDEASVELRNPYKDNNIQNIKGNINERYTS
jgi:hypothetical protein